MVVKEPKTKTLSKSDLLSGNIYKVETQQGETSKFMFCGGDNILLLPSMKGSFLIQSDKIYN